MNTTPTGYTKELSAEQKLRNEIDTCRTCMLDVTRAKVFRDYWRARYDLALAHLEHAHMQRGADLYMRNR